ncbi:TIR domain-containing protein [Paraburkholderia sediminicola]|uniref:TIR domain-containing protein n=1 Tax=Paraburkholderia sediminicola TaxID=458836 RepID=UPI0038B825C0
MKIFVSWSKEPAKSIAVELKHFLEMTLRTVEVWVSESDLQKGKRWGPQIAEELNSTNVGIICVTPNNMLEPWLHFEAGALSKSIADAAIHPLCLGVGKGELPFTLAQFQATVFKKEDFLDLVIAINSASGAPEKESGVRERFERGWEGLENSAAKAFETHPTAAAEKDLVKAVVHGNAYSSPPRLAASPASFSDDEEKLIKLIAERGRLTMAELQQQLKVPPTRFEHYVDNLKGYVYKLPLQSGHELTLTEQGRALAVKKGWV